MALGDGGETVIPVIWLDAHPLCWDQHIVDRMFTGPHFEHDADQVNTGGVLVVPARYYNPDAIRDLLDAWQWAVVLLTSDEEATFNPQRLTAETRRTWVQTPAEHHDRMLPLGPPPTEIPSMVTSSDMNPWFFAGQVNHVRRIECVEALRFLGGGDLVVTEGFTLGLHRYDYLKRMSRAKVVPCPSGPQTPDTFRVWEALEVGAIPLADAMCPKGRDGYWDWLTPGAPLPVVRDWSTLPEIIPELAALWPANANRVSAWWLQYQRNLRRRLWRDVSDLSGVDLAGQVTVLIPTSPIPSHPSTAIIEETVNSVRFHHPDVDILIMCDGVRETQEGRRSAYEHYLRRLNHLCRAQWRNVTPIIFDRCTHQADMTRETLNHVDTPLVLFVEHDTPLVVDEPIPWAELVTTVRTERANMIRLHHEALILDVHRHLMLDEGPQDVDGVPMVRTVQWSQRPHLASTAYYRWMLRRHFPAGRRTMIEDTMHGVVQTDWREYGLAGWDRHKVWVYAPDGNTKRSYHTDGRAGDEKYATG